MNNKAQKPYLTSGAAVPNALIHAWLFLLRQDVKFMRLQVLWLHKHNQLSRSPIVSPGGPVVSMTTHGQRVHSVYLSLESIGRGTILPSRIILWIDNEKVFRNLPVSIKRLQERGLEVVLTENYGPHTKYYPYLLSSPSLSLPLATADDDVLYSGFWLAGLAAAHAENSELIHCYRAHVARLSGDQIAAYATWERCRSIDPSLLHFPTGSFGCIYPPAFLEKLRRAGDAFLDACPRADDIWLHANAVRSRVPVKQITSHSPNFPQLPETQASRLSSANVEGGGNDIQIQRTYSASDMATLRESMRKDQPILHEALS
jgi:hypothetical protein